MTPLRANPEVGAKRYRTVVADPPWPLRYSGKGARSKGDGNPAKYHVATFGVPYATMTIDEIAALPVASVLADDAHLYLWTTDEMLLSGDAVRVARAWGTKPVRTLVWAKRSYGMGNCWRPAHEIIVVCRRGSLPFEGSVSFGTVLDLKQPYMKSGRSVGKAHSAKPDGFLDMVEQASPGPYLEMFARRARFGWSYWGDESLGTAEMAA